MRFWKRKVFILITAAVTAWKNTGKMISQKKKRDSAGYRLRYFVVGYKYRRAYEYPCPNALIEIGNYWALRGDLDRLMLIRDDVLRHIAARSLIKDDVLVFYRKVKIK